MLEKITNYMIPVISVGLSYILGRIQSTQSDIKSAYKEAYDLFYLPFIALLYESQIWTIGFSRLDIKIRHKLFALISGNIKYMDKPIIEYVDILYAHYSAVLGKDLLNIDSLLTHDKTDEIFDEVAIRVLSRATWLAKKLHQPKIGEFVLELYLDGKEEREIQQTKVL